MREEKEGEGETSKELKGAKNLKKDLNKKKEKKT